SPKASQTLAIVQILRKAQPYEKTMDEDSFKSRIVKVMGATLTSDRKLLRTLIVPELDDTGTTDRELSVSTHAMLANSDTSPTMVADLFAAAVEVQQDGNDDIGYRLRMRSASGVDAAKNVAFYMQRRGDKYLLAAMSTSPDTIGRAALKLVNDGKTDAARTWLNWARESIAAGGGDDALAGPPFARLWQKEKPAASADEIRLAAAALMVGKDYAKESAPLLASLRETAPSDELKTAADLALVSAYTHLSDWEKALPV